MANVPRCPLCGSEKSTPTGLVRTKRTIVEERRCLSCGEVFYTDDDGNAVSLDSQTKRTD
jgi:uncharacterized Zn finger protein